MSNRISFNTQALTTYLASTPTTESTSMGADLISAPLDIRQSQTFAMQFERTGTPTVNLKIMGSLDGTNYNVEFDTHAAGGAAGDYTFDLAATAGLVTSCGWVRGEYERTSGTGALTLVRACTKYPALI